MRPDRIGMFAVGDLLIRHQFQMEEVPYPTADDGVLDVLHADTAQSAAIQGKDLQPRSAGRALEPVDQRLDNLGRQAGDRHAKFRQL